MTKENKTIEMPDRERELIEEIDKIIKSKSYDFSGKEWTIFVASKEILLEHSDIEAVMVANYWAEYFGADQITLSEFHEGLFDLLKKALNEYKIFSEYVNIQNSKY